VISDATELHMFRQSVSSVHKTTRADMSSQTPWANLVEGLERLLSLRAGTPNFDPDVYARTKRMIVDTATRVSAAETAKINKMESELQQLKRELMEMRNALADTKQELQELRQLNEAALR
jgi:TolA-binding protein